MSRIVLISCASKKLPHKAAASELYTSPLFRLNFLYAERLRPDAIYILSAKHGLVRLDVEIEPYDVTLNTMPLREARSWADRVLGQLAEVSDLSRDHYTFLAGDKYRRFLIPHIQHYEIPLSGLGLGRQLQRLKVLTS